MRWTIYERPTGREIMQIDAPNHPAAIAAAKLTGLDGEVIGARVGTPTALAALSSFETAFCGVRARVRKIEVTERKRWGTEPIFIEHTGVRGDREADRWAIRSTGGECYGRDGWQDEPSPSERDEAFFERCRWTLDDALRAVEAMRDDEPVVGGGS